MIRPPAVAGTFYPDDVAQLQSMLDSYTSAQEDRRDAVAVMAPHAGYIYSGGVAGTVYRSVVLPARYIILCPNHTGRGEPFSAYLRGSWDTPLGSVPVDDEMASELARRFPRLRHDSLAHEREHSLEVQLPFLQHLRGAFRFVPICVASHELEALSDLGEAVAAVVRTSSEPVLLVISSDMSHYISAEEARQRDHRALEPLQRLDPEALHRTVHDEGISMCGIAPAVAGVFAARSLGARQGRLTAYANSGETNGDFARVVGYAGVVFS